MCYIKIDLTSSKRACKRIDSLCTLILHYCFLLCESECDRERSIAFTRSSAASDAYKCVQASERALAVDGFQLNEQVGIPLDSPVYLWRLCLVDSMDVDTNYRDTDSVARKTVESKI